MIYLLHSGNSTFALTEFLLLRILPFLRYVNILHGVILLYDFACFGFDLY